MRSFLIGLTIACGARVAAAAPDTIEMGAWDCKGSPVKEVAVQPGEHVFAWHGSCGGAEGWDVIVEPRSKDFTTKLALDDKTHTLTLRVINKGAVRTVKMHVFVGFA